MIPALHQPHILLIKFSALGDLVQLSRTVLFLRAYFPGCRIDLLTSPLGASLYGSSPYFGHIELWRRRKLPLQPWQFIGLLRRFAGRRYDLLVDMQSNKASGLMTLGIPARHVLRNGYGPFRRMFLGKPPYDAGRTIETLLTGAGFAPAPAGLQERLDTQFLEVAPATGAEADALLRAEGWDGRRELYAIAPGSSPQWPTKRWPAARFRELLTTAALQAGQAVLLGDAGERELVNEIRAGNASAIDLCGKTTLGLLPAIIARCRLLVGNDSAPVHIAAAVGTPTITLFGPTLAERHKPALFYPGMHLALQADSPCAGKYLKSCTLHPGRSCLDGITVDSVAAQAVTLLAQTQAADRSG